MTVLTFQETMYFITPNPQAGTIKIQRKDNEALEAYVRAYDPKKKRECGNDTLIINVGEAADLGIALVSLGDGLKTEAGTLPDPPVEFSAKERAIINNALAYADNPFGDIGHAQKMLIAKLYRALMG